MQICEYEGCNLSKFNIVAIYRKNRIVYLRHLLTNVNKKNHQEPLQDWV